MVESQRGVGCLDQLDGYECQLRLTHASSIFLDKYLQLIMAAWTLRISLQLAKVTRINKFKTSSPKLSILDRVSLVAS